MLFIVMATESSMYSTWVLWVPAFQQCSYEELPVQPVASSDARGGEASVRNCIQMVDYHHSRLINDSD